MIFICRAVFVMLTMKFQCFPGFERSPTAGRIPLWFMHCIHVVYVAQFPHISDPGGILPRAKTSQGEYLPHKRSIMMLVRYVLYSLCIS